MATGGWRLVAGLAAVVLAVAACGGSDDEPAGLDEDSPSPDVTEDSSPEPTSEPSEPAETETPETTTAAGLIDFELPPGLSFVDVPEVEEDSPEASALRAYLIFEAYTWQVHMEDEVPEEVFAVAGPSAVAYLEGQISYQQDNGYHMGGDLTVAPTIESATDQGATISVCVDQSESIIINDDGTEGTPTHPEGRRRAILENVGVGWQVTSLEDEAGC